jgi:hypothetical protein
VLGCAVDDGDGAALGPALVVGGAEAWGSTIGLTV